MGWRRIPVISWGTFVSSTGRTENPDLPELKPSGDCVSTIAVYEGDRSYVAGPFEARISLTFVLSSALPGRAFA